MKAIDWLQERLRERWQFISPLLAVGGLVFVFLGAQKQVTLSVNGEAIEISTHARRVGSLLGEVGVSFEAGDQISPDITTPIEDGLLIVYESSSPIILDEEGDLTFARTTQTLPENILAQAGVRLYPGDSVTDFLSSQVPSSEISSMPISWLRIERGYPIELQRGEEISHISSSAPTLGQALWDAGITLYAGDSITPGPHTALDRPLTVVMQPAEEYAIEVDGERLFRHAAGDTVGEIISNAGITLVGLDYTIPAANDPLPANGVVKVIRVAERLMVELEPVEFSTVYQPAEQLELDTLEVLEPGTFGVQSKTIRIRYEDGEETSRTIEDTVIAVEPKNRVIGYGTKIVVRTLDTGQGTIEYWRAIPIYATSYSPCNLGVPWCGTLTASGKVVDRGIIGVIRSWYRLMRGWSVYVPGYGPGTFEDIGAGIAGRDWIDLGFRDDNFEPWHQWTTLYFLTPVPPLDSIPWILP